MRKSLPKFESALYWLVLALLMFIPLYLKFPFQRIKGTFVSIRLEDILIAVTLALWLLYLWASGGIKVLLKDKLNQALLLFFFVGAVSVFSATYLTKTIQFNLGMLHYLRRIELMLLLPLTISVVKKKRQVYYYLASLSVVVLIVNIYALGQKYLGFPVISTINSELSKGLIYFLGDFDRISSTFSGHYDLAIFLVIFLSIATSLAFYVLNKKKKEKSDGSKKVIIFTWMAILGLLSSLVLVMTAARLSFIAAILGIFSSLFLVGKKRITVLILAILMLFALYPSQLRERYISTFTINIQQSFKEYSPTNEEQVRRSLLNIPTLPATGVEIETEGAEAADIAPGEPVNMVELGVYRSFAIRTQVEWPRAVRAFLKNPLLGTGYSSISLATDNDFLRSLGEVGLLGTVAFALILFEIIKRVWLQYRHQTGFRRYFSAGCLSMIVALLVNSLFIDVFEASKVASIFWMILGLNLGLAKITKKV